MVGDNFLNELSTLLKESEIVSELVIDRRSGSGENLGSIPRLFGTVDKYPVKFDFMSRKEVKIEINFKTQHYMFITHFNKLTRFLDKWKLSRAVKLNDAKFNEVYNLRDVEKDVAEVTLSKQNIELLKAMEPFDFFRMTFKEYRVVKDIDMSYTPEDAYNDIRNLVNFVKNCDLTWNTERVFKE